MSVIHRHRWIEVRRQVVPGLLDRMKGQVKAKGLTSEMMFGYTLVELRCEECGDVVGRKLPESSECEA